MKFLNLFKLKIIGKIHLLDICDKRTKTYKYRDIEEFKADLDELICSLENFEYEVLDESIRNEIESSIKVSQERLKEKCPYVIVTSED